MALRGHAMVRRNGEAALELPFGPEVLTRCHSFSQRKGCAGYFLHHHLDDSRKVLDKTIKGKGICTVEMELSAQPPPGSTLWLWYLRWYD